MKHKFKSPLHKITWATSAPCELYEARVTTRSDEFDRDTNDRPRENFLYITVWLDTGAVSTESYYVCESLKTVYESFLKAIKQANEDGFIPDSVISHWAEPEGTSIINNADGSPRNLVTNDGTPIFSDGGQGISFYRDINQNGESVYFITSCLKVR